jgi:3-hydroxyacyl-CoA dehydrogenase/enoyl-CoA hydratase/3-hydroxybutyryl-CoA epimerase
MNEIAVVGPGLMGLGIAQIAAGAGLRVHLVGRDADGALRGRDRLAQQLDREVKRGRLQVDAMNALLDRVMPARDDGALAHCALAIEAVAEERAVKDAVLQRLQAALPPSAWIATNTSGLPISSLARTLRDPARLVGLHFFSPVPRMKLVEVVRGEVTSDATLQSALGFVECLGQVRIVVRDEPGFFTSRVFAAYLDEALAMLSEGVDPALIERVAVNEGGRAIGPLAVLDDISLELN